jgi:hypothetical protein
MLFQLQESALMLKGADKIERLSQLHAQILVLRGGAFDSFIFCVFCAFGWCANQSNRLARIIPTLFFVAGAVAFGAHLFSHITDFSDPPFMELTFLCLGVAGFSIVGRGNVSKQPYGQYLLLSVLVTAIAYFGWWWSEILYDGQVLHMFAVSNLVK